MKKLFAVFASIVLFFSVTMPVSAQILKDCSILGGGTVKGIDTAIGCVPVETQKDFLVFALTWALGIGGGIAFILIIYATFLIMTSSGVPDKIKAGQELLTSALAGILMLVFSTYILQLIGVSIFHIPGII